MTRDHLVFGLVISLRFVMPLVILRFPIPGLFLAMLADGDRAILHAYTDLPLDNYQLYDKSLDLYYLSIAYVATLRNWRDPTARTVARALWFYRLIGVALFALIGDRRLLFLFPAAFEFFFLAYEIFRSRWSVHRLTGTHLVHLAALAWLCKLPQEYWLHIARRGTTAWLERTVYRTDPSWTHVWLLLLVLGTVAIVRPAAHAVLRRLPPPDHPVTLDANRLEDHPWPDGGGNTNAAAEVVGRFGSALFEKVALVTLVGMLFSEFVPGIDASTIQVTLGLAFLVVANATLSARLSAGDPHRRTPLHDVARTAAINLPIAVTLAVVAPTFNASMATAGVVFFVLLTSLLIGLHDHYHPLQASPRPPRPDDLLA